MKFGLPMAFTITMLSWSVVEYGHHMKSAGELQHAIEAIRWGTDYLLKAHSQPNVLWGEVCSVTLSSFLATSFSLSLLFRLAYLH